MLIKLNILITSRGVFINKNSLVIISKPIWCLEFSNNNSISKKLLLNFFFINTPLLLLFIYKITFFNFCYWLATSKLVTFLEFGRWCQTILTNKISIFWEISVKHGPTPFASLIQIVAWEYMLRWKHWDINTIFHSKSLFYSLNEW